MRRAFLAITTALLVFTYAAPAIGGPDLTALVKRVDKREQRHYESLDRRIKATVALVLTSNVTTTVDSALMTQSADGQFFTGTARCTTGRLAGGGVDWGTSTVYAGYRVIASAPDAGGYSWHATVATGGAPTPAGFPDVYAVCASG